MMLTLNRKRMSGFTLIELVMVIVLIGALASVSSVFITGPVEGFIDANRRAALVDIAETALQRMTREIHFALPNSVRIFDAGSGPGSGVEYLNTLTGGRYRASKAIPAVGTDELNFNKKNDTFDILGGLPGFTLIDKAVGANQADCLNNTVDCLVIYNTGTSATDFNAYNTGTGNDNIAAITAVSDTSMTFDNENKFPAQSPSKRFFVVDGPVSFVCTGNQVLMYQGYDISAIAGVFNNGISAVLADQVTNCNAAPFTYNAGAGVRYGLVVIRLTITDPNSSESISLQQQAHVLNAP